MNQYITKRLLMMIPTMFFITLVVFVILQFAPGKPGGAAMMDKEGSKQTQQAGYMIFKQQFHLDKPVLFNTRWPSEQPFLGIFGVSSEQIEALLKTAANKKKEFTIKEMVRAMEVLEDYGNSILPQLIHLIQFSPNPDTVRMALAVFPRHARQPLYNPYGKEIDDEMRAHNQAIEADNRRVAQFVYVDSMTENEVETLKAKVVGYFQEKAEKYDYKFTDKVKIFFFDTRFAHYLGNLVTLDFGVSHVDKRPVLPKIMERMHYSIALSVLSILIAYLLAIPLGIYSAVRPGSVFDQVSTVTLFMLFSLPTFFVGTLLLFYFSEGGEYFKWFPTGGFQSLNSDAMTTLDHLKDIAWHLILPLICLTYISLASISRYARTGLLDVIHADYIKTARAKGLEESVVVLKHAVRNGMIPIITLLGSVLPAVVSGSVVIEVIFNIPGIGLAGYEAVKLRDYNMVMAIQLISAFLTLIGLLISDILYCLVDPRISYE